jgi:small-conductance mechanosensitive channel
MDKLLHSANAQFENGFWSAFAVSVVIALAAWITVKLLSGALKRRAAHGRLDATSAAFFRRALGAAAIIVAAMLIFLQIKPLRGVATSLLASSGVLAVIIGFAAQQAMSNVIGGFFISVFKTISMGDRVRLPEKAHDHPHVHEHTRHRAQQPHEHGRHRELPL